MRYILALAFCLASLGLAQPRVGTEDGLTRLVFGIPSEASYSLHRQNNEVSIRFQGTPPRTLRTLLNTPQVVGYRATPSAGGSIYVVTLRAGTRYRTLELSNPRRLVLEVRGHAATHPRPRSTARAPTAVVVLDPGHGGIDPGAVGLVREEEAVLEVALLTRRLLEARGIQVVLTRTGDQHLSPNKATDLGLRAAMADSKRTLFVSIHANAAERAAQGIEVYYFGETIDQRLLSKAILENGGGMLGQRLTQEARSVAQRLMRDLLAQANLKFSEQLALKTLRSLVRETGAVSRGVHTAPFYVIRNARIPAILVEIGFVNHPEEGRKLATRAYRQQLANGLAGGITAFLNSGNAQR
ncbi:N-acetylmuramoyl-L-alanine amidase [Meiothermus sp.]|uniref:N-acetylmuramoyl-L-alanine amidase family protein n=1 Tax=Meiothermus sp. TaxID=1955249 RepID=UPI00298EF57D|nr:N-acetylmuramoyl-L-alanine amidase [Meiothermus sp.]MCS7068971.1 N-acetylmuramoyl-L-alanine amidase [Meiothermus sp.]